MKATTHCCLVTGGAGFIGSHLCDRLLADGHSVIVLDSLLTGKKENIDHLIGNDKFSFFIQDVTKPIPNKILQKLGSVTHLFHLASPASPPKYRTYPIETMLVNSIGTYNMLELARKMKAIFILASTSEVYGDPLEHPQTETYFGNVNPVGARACYDEGKRFSEAITAEYRRSFGLKTRIARIFNTYGPRMQASDGRVISNFVVAALKGKQLTIYGIGNQTRSFCFVSDLVDGLVRYSERSLDGEIINLGNPREYTIRDVAHEVLTILGSKAAIGDGGERLENDPERRQPDISKAKKLLGWIPKVSLHEGLSFTAEYFKDRL
jgi:nucleoside-diphosphate-sugar epimerase